MNGPSVESYGATSAIASSYWRRGGVLRSSSCRKALDQSPHDLAIGRRGFCQLADRDSGNQPTSILAISRVVERGSTARFVCGVPPCDGKAVSRFGDRLFAVPLRLLWESA